MSYYYLFISSVDGLDTQIETNKFVLKVFISSLQMKPRAKELLQNCIFVVSCCFQYLECKIFIQSGLVLGEQNAGLLII